MGKQGDKLLSARERIRLLRMQHIEVWLEEVGFRGSIEYNAADFISHKLGYTSAYVTTVLRGYRDLGTHAALTLRSLVPNPERIQFDYRVLTDKVRTILNISEEDMTKEVEAMRRFTEGVPVSEADRPTGAPGFDENGCPQVLIVLSDGQMMMVKLPPGTKIEGVPWVDKGELGETGSLNLLFAKDSDDSTATPVEMRKTKPSGSSSRRGSSKKS